MVKATVPRVIPKAKFMISSAMPIVLNPIAKKMDNIAILIIEATKALSSFLEKFFAAILEIQFPITRITKPKTRFI